MEKKSRSEEFYKDLDEVRSHQSCCTCQTMAIFFMFLLALILGTIFFLIWQYNKEKANLKNIPQKIAGEILSSKFNIVNNSPDGSLSQISLPISNDELTKIVASGFSFDNFMIKDLQAQINPKEIIFAGRLTKPFSYKMVITALPKIVDRKIQMDVTSVRTGSINWPGFLAKQLSSNISNFLNQKIWILYQTFNPEEITLQENQMIIKGELK